MAARPSHSVTSHDSSVTPGRARVRDFSARAAARIEWDVRVAYDFLFSLHSEAGSTDDLPADDRRWLSDAKAALTARVGGALRHLEEVEPEIHVASLLIDRPDVQRAAQVVDTVGATSTTELFQAIVADFSQERRVADLVERHVGGKPGALEELKIALPEWKPEYALLFEDPNGVHARLLEVLHEWAGLFGPIEDRVRAIQSRDHALRSRDRNALEPMDLIETTTGGIRWLPEAGVRRVILAPSYFSRPYNILLAGPDWRFFGYPVADEAVGAADPLAPPPGTVRLHRALGDDTRMRILKLLAGRDLYLTEIAQQLDLSKPTIKHHLALLRAAGLVTITEAGSVMYYTLRRSRLDDASGDLKRFLEA
ncbi:MAG: ArsR/SmtB family transcription factor [Chloroflexota bacterium]